MVGHFNQALTLCCEFGLSENSNRFVCFLKQFSLPLRAKLCDLGQRHLVEMSVAHSNGPALEVCDLEHSLIFSLEVFASVLFLFSYPDVSIRPGHMTCSSALWCE